MVRNKELPLDGALRQYEQLHEKYNIPVQSLASENQNYTTLVKLMNNIKPFSTENQKVALEKIAEFAAEILNHY